MTLADDAITFIATKQSPTARGLIMSCAVTRLMLLLIFSDHKPSMIGFNNLLPDRHHLVPPNAQAASPETVANWSQADDLSIFIGVKLK